MHDAASHVRKRRSPRSCNFQGIAQSQSSGNPHEAGTLNTVKVTCKEIQMFASSSPIRRTEPVKRAMVHVLSWGVSM